MSEFPIQPRTLAEIDAENRPPCAPLEMISHPPCLACGGIVPRRNKENPSKWLRRNTCSPACRKEHHRKALVAFNQRIKSQRDALRVAADKGLGHSPCANCGKPVLRRKGEQLKDWRRRKCCSTQCHCDYRSQLAMEKYNSTLVGVSEHSPCIECNGPAERRADESRASWLHRKLCSKQCTLAHSIAKLKVGKDRADSSRRAARALEAAPEKHPPCLHCGGPVTIRARETIEEWINRKDCSRRCCDARRRKPRSTDRTPKTAQAPATATVRISAKPRAKTQFETVEEALARGITITRIETPVVAAIGNPVRVRAGWLG